MNKRLGWLFLAVFSIFVLLLPTVLAADIISDALSPIGDFNLVNVYTKFGPFLDFVFLAVLFIGVAQFALKDQFKDMPVVPTILGIILSVAATYFANRMGFHLVDLGPFALTIGLVLIGILVFKIIQGAGGDYIHSAAWAIVFVWFGLNTFFRAIMNNTPGLMPVFAIVNIVALVAFIAVLMSGLQWGFAQFGGGGTSGQTTADAETGKKTAEAQTEKLKKEQQEEEREVQELVGLEQKELTDLEQAKEFLEELIELVRNYRGNPNAIKEIKSVAGNAFKSMTKANDDLELINSRQDALNEYIKREIKTMEDAGKISRELGAYGAGTTAAGTAKTNIIAKAATLRAKANTLQNDLKSLIKQAKTLNARIISEFKQGNNALAKQPGQAIRNYQNAIKFITRSKAMIGSMATFETEFTNLMKDDVNSVIMSEKAAAGAAWTT